MGMMSLRRRVMELKGGGLPYDAEIEFLQSSGTQYIDTGMKANGETTELKLRYSGFTNKYFACGSRTGVTNKAFVFSNGGNSSTIYDKFFINYGTTYTPNVVCPNDENIHNVIFTNVIILDDVEVYRFPVIPFESDRNLFLFATNNADRVRYGNMRIYSCQLYDAGELVRDYIPVRVGTTGYLYDKVSGELFGNQGTGDFILGPDKN